MNVDHELVLTQCQTHFALSVRYALVPGAYIPVKAQQQFHLVIRHMKRYMHATRGGQVSPQISWGHSVLCTVLVRVHPMNDHTPSGGTIKDLLNILMPSSLPQVPHLQPHPSHHIVRRRIF